MDKVRTEIRLLYKREKPTKAWRSYERGLVNLTRKLRPGERIDVLIHAERLALSRINERLAKRRRG